MLKSVGHGSRSNGLDLMGERPCSYDEVGEIAYYEAANGLPRASAFVRFSLEFAGDILAVVIEL